MKRFLHALAALWSKKRATGSSPLADPSTAIPQHLAAVLRMERALSGFANLPIRGFTEEAVSAGTLNTVLDQFAESSAQQLPESPDTRLVESTDTQPTESMTRQLKSSAQQLPESPDTRLVESTDTQPTESMTRQLKSSAQQLPESPDTRLVESTNTRLAESTTRQLNESPDTRLIESTDTRLDDSPNQQIVESPNQPNNLPRIPQPMPLLTILMLTFFMCLMAAPSRAIGTAAFLDSIPEFVIRPLQIGDTIPEELWHLPLQVVNHPEGKETITLNDYRGKLILIDFLSFGCSSCIKALPRIDSLQWLFPDSLFVMISQRADRHQAIRFFSENYYGGGAKLCATVSDHILPKYFPHWLISHVVWINRQGVLCSTTGTDLIHSQNIQHLLSKGDPNWLPKWESTTLDYSHPLFAVDVQGNHQIRTPMQYTVFGGYIEGAVSRLSHIKDTVAGLSRHRLINLPLYHFILACFGEHPQMFPSNQVHWSVGSENHYRFIPSDTIPQSVWEREHLYSYEATIPINHSDLEWRLILKQDLQRFFPSLEFCMREDTVPCLYLVRYGDETTDNDWVGRGVASTASWAAAFNQRLPIPVIDASENMETIAIPFELFDEVNNVEQARSILKKVGYDLQPGKHKLMQLFISDISYALNQDEEI